MRHFASILPLDEKGKKLSIDLARPKKPFEGRLSGKGGGRGGGEERKEEAVKIRE